MMLRSEMSTIKQGKDEPIRAYIGRLMVMRGDAKADDQFLRDVIINNVTQATRDALERRLDMAYPPVDGKVLRVDDVPLKDVLRLLQQERWFPTK